MRADCGLLEFETGDKMAAVGYDNGDVVLFGLATKDVLAVASAPAEVGDADAAVVAVETGAERHNTWQMVVARVRSIEIWDMCATTAPLQRVRLASEVVGISLDLEVGVVGVATRAGACAVVDSESGCVQWVAASTSASGEEATAAIIVRGKQIQIAGRSGTLSCFSISDSSG